MSEVYLYRQNGRYAGTAVAVEHPDHPGTTMVPDRSTPKKPPVCEPGEVAFFDTGKDEWVVIIDWTMEGNPLPLVDKKTMKSVYIDRPGVTPEDIGATTHNPFEDIQMNGDLMTLITKGVHWSESAGKFVVNPSASDMFKYNIVTGEAVVVADVDTDMEGFTRAKPYAIRYMSYDAATDSWKNDPVKQVAYIETVRQEHRAFINGTWKDRMYAQFVFESKAFSVSQESRESINSVQNYLTATGELPATVKADGWKAVDNSFVPMDESKWVEFYKAFVEYDMFNFKRVNEIKDEFFAIDVQITEQNTFEVILENLRSFTFSYNGEKPYTF